MVAASSVTLTLTGHNYQMTRSYIVCSDLAVPMTVLISWRCGGVAERRCGGGGRGEASGRHGGEAGAAGARCSVSGTVGKGAASSGHGGEVGGHYGRGKAVRLVNALDIECVLDQLVFPITADMLDRRRRHMCPKTEPLADGDTKALISLAEDADDGIRVTAGCVGAGADVGLVAGTISSPPRRHGPISTAAALLPVPPL
uniref:Uncharacterized protein n=1 Tax=Oryza rufipogon TaxID=4529 RepID=A0A0E0RAB6_ORYRU